MNAGMMEAALASTLEELEAVRKKEEEQIALLKGIEERLERIEQVLKEVRQGTAKPISTAPLETVLAKGMSRLQQTIEAQPKAVVHERRILLFPEWNAKEYYKTVVARLSLAVIAVILTTFLFLLCRQFINDWYIVHLGEKELHEYKMPGNKSIKQRTNAKP